MRRLYYLLLFEDIVPIICTKVFQVKQFLIKLIHKISTEFP